MRFTPRTRREKLNSGNDFEAAVHKEHEDPGEGEVAIFIAARISRRQVKTSCSLKYEEIALPHDRCNLDIATLPKEFEADHCNTKNSHSPDHGNLDITAVSKDFECQYIENEVSTHAYGHSVYQTGHLHPVHVFSLVHVRNM